jgi:hypothetical protein
MTFNQGTADGQAHSHTIRFRCKEGSEEAMCFRAKASTGVADRDQYVARVVDPGLHAERTRSICDRRHSLYAIQDQVQQDLLHLNPISRHQRESPRQLPFEPDSILINLTVSQSQHLLNNVVYVQPVLFGRFLLYESADSGNNGARSIAVGNDFLKSPAQNLRLQVTSGQQSQARIAVIGYSGKRLIDFVGDGRCQFAHGCQPGNAGKLRLGHLQRLLCFLPIMQIHNGPEPFDDTTILITQRQSARNAPAICVVRRPPAAELILKRLTR